MFDIILRVTKVYYSDISEITLNNNLVKSLPILRQEYVNSFNDSKRKKQSVFVWKLFEYVIEHFYGMKIKNASCDKNGVWKTEGLDVNFSFAHSNEIVAVAISDGDVGVDVEKCSEKILKLKDKLTNTFSSLPIIEALTFEWTRRESLFKSKTGKNYYYKKIFDVLKNQYYLTVCSDDQSADFVEINAENLY